MRRAKCIIVLAAWFAVIGAGGWWQLRYEQTPGRAWAVPAKYPEDGPIIPRSGCGVAIMALHPRCPCSRASLAELEQFASRGHGQVDVVVLACTPAGAGADWIDSANCATARAIPGVRFVIDPAGRAAARLGMKTSGHVVVYDAHGRLVFSGGITPSRGQTGPSHGLDVLITMADNHEPPAKAASAGAAPTITPVFGCDLVSPEKCAAVRGKDSP